MCAFILLFPHLKFVLHLSFPFSKISNAAFVSGITAAILTATSSMTESILVGDEDQLDLPAEPVSVEVSNLIHFF